MALSDAFSIYHPAPAETPVPTGCPQVVTEHGDTEAKPGFLITAAVWDSS